MNDRIKNALTYAAAILVIGLVALQLFRMTDKDGMGMRIRSTPVIVERIRPIGQLTTACYCEEIVLHERKDNSLTRTPLGGYANSKVDRRLEDEIVLIASGKVRAGVDLSKMSEEDVFRRGDTLVIDLPPVEIFDVLVNPSGFEIFSESGTWDHEQVTAVENKARALLLQDAEAVGLRDQATATARERIRSLLSSLDIPHILFE